MRASGYERAQHEFYVEPSWVVDKLIAAEHAFSGPIWDPCCGIGTIPKAMTRHGLKATGTDLIDRGFGQGGFDFFHTACHAASIVSNPPFSRAEAFIERALSMTTDRVCVLLRLAFLEGQARAAWHQQFPVARLWVSSRRVSMPPGDLLGSLSASGGTVAYGWFVYQHRPFYDPPRIGWLP